MPTPLITLATDFGEATAYVGMLKGALLRSCPEARLVDLSHRLASRPIWDAAFLLLRVYSYYPAGTIHLVGIDDGGGIRRVLIAETSGQFFLAADNGALGFVLQREPATVYSTALLAPATFLARDVLAPLAARLAGGESPGGLGVVVADWQRLELPIPQRGPDGIHGQILHVDRFGNLLTNLTRADVAPTSPPTLQVGSTLVSRWHPDYSAPPGELFLLWGAEGWLEVSLARASAADRLHVRAGAEVVLR